MRAVVFFIVVAILIFGWQCVSGRQKKEVKRIGGMAVTSILISASIVIALIFFALNFSGKLI